MARNFLLIVFSFLPFFLFSQTHTVTLDETAFDERYHKSKLIIPLFRYVSPELEEYQKFGVPVKKAPAKYTIKKLPDMKGCRDTAYGYVFFAGAPSAVNEGYITILVCNHLRRTFDPSIIFADKNNNLDFTDDGPADTFSYYAPYVDITLKNLANSNAGYTVRLSRFSFSKDEQYRQMLDKYYMDNQGNRIFSGVDYSFKENRMNMRGGTYYGEVDTFKIALYDGNFDGLYNNEEFDAVYLGRISDTVFYDDYKFSFNEGLKNAEFEWNFKVYRVTEIDPAGKFIKFYWDKSAQSKRNLKVGKKLPKFKFYLHDAQTQQKIRKYRKKPTYIYFWNTSNPNIDSDTATLRQIHERFGNCINVVTLNFGDFYKTVSAIKTLDKVPYTMGISNRKINRIFNIEKLPSGYLFKKRLKLYKTGVTPQQMLQMLEEGRKKD